MCALTLNGKMRALKMQAEKTRHPRTRSFVPGGNRSRSRFARVGNKSGQKTGGAEHRVRPAHFLKTLDATVTVEHHTAAAIHLKVYEARHDHRAARFAHRKIASHFSAHFEPEDLTVLDSQYMVVQPGLTVKNTRAGGVQKKTWCVPVFESLSAFGNFQLGNEIIGITAIDRAGEFDHPPIGQIGNTFDVESSLPGGDP